MNIGGFQKLTLLDYPGQIACIVFTGGCNFRCPFCHNAGLVLPGQAVAPVREEDVLAYLDKRKGLLDGVVVTGGEPLLQPDLAAFLREVRARGYKIKLDTNGSFPDRLEALLSAGLVDYAAMDVKQAPAKYDSASGVLARAVVPLVERSLRLLAASGVPYELRTTVVKGIHTPEDMAALAHWIAGLVPDAPYYLQPYKQSEHIIAPAELAPFSAEELPRLLAAAQAFCPGAALRG